MKPNEQNNNKYLETLPKGETSRRLNRRLLTRTLLRRTLIVPTQTTRTDALSPTSAQNRQKQKYTYRAHFGARHSQRGHAIPEVLSFFFFFSREYGQELFSPSQDWHYYTLRMARGAAFSCAGSSASLVPSTMLRFWWTVLICEGRLGGNTRR